MTIRAIILAAGFGSRLMPYTADRPKGMVELVGFSLLERQLMVMANAGLSDVIMVGGYRSEELAAFAFPVVVNDHYEITNMVSSLMCAREYLDGRKDVIIAYSDIVYEKRVLKMLLDTPGDLVVVADRNWRDLWEARMEAPLEDAETFRVNEAGHIVEFGRKAESFSDIQGQYTGLIKISAARQTELLEFYDGLKTGGVYEGQSYAGMYLTGFIQLLIDEGWAVSSAWIENGWLEVDTVDDLQRYHLMLESGAPTNLCDLNEAGGVTSKVESVFPGIGVFIETRVGGVEPQNKPNSFWVAKFIWSVWLGAIPSHANLSRLDRLARKIEIAGKIYRCYEKDMSPDMDEGLLSLQSFEATLALYLAVFVITGDARHLNTVLKGVGVTLGLSENEIDPLLKKWIESAVRLVEEF